ncbi:MAG: hypothetical protein LBC38_02975 [Oscillospiraceae bacterium]|jgi:heme/copper-type cytochrome/quinol oxidase subunit 3|nr:hypothetical protein [Oscillospiraceae bacterium]
MKNILIGLVIFFVAALVLFLILFGIYAWYKNKKAPQLTVDAFVADKRAGGSNYGTILAVDFEVIVDGRTETLTFYNIPSEDFHFFMKYDKG